MFRVYSGSVEPTPLERALPQPVPERLVDLIGSGPADVGAPPALAAVEAVMRDRVQDANVATVEALDPKGSHLTAKIGAAKPAQTPRTSDA
jgi:hypothetical protein